MQNHFKIIHLILAHDYLFYYFEDREELITEHALRWNKRKIVGMAQSLAIYSCEYATMCIMYVGADEDLYSFLLLYIPYRQVHFFFLFEKEKELLP